MPEFSSSINATSQIPINFTTISDCQAYRPNENPVANASATIQLSLDGTSWETCTPVTNSLNGHYNCTWNSIAKEEGQWDIMLNSTKQGYFYSNSSVYTDWFELLNWNVSNVTTPSVTPTSGGWTRIYNYTVGVYDQEGDTVNCSLMVSNDNQTSWEYKGSSIVAGSPGTPTNGVCYKAMHDFDCADIGNDSWFMWRIENGNPLHAWNTTPIQGPNLTASTVNVVYIEGSNYVFNRSSGSNQVRRLGVNVYDTENSSYVSGANVSFWLTNQSTTYRLETKNSTNANGNASYYFNPDCTHLVGMQYWIAGTTDSCYVDANTTTNYTLNVTGDLKLTVTSPNGEKYLRGINNTILRGDIVDECGVAITGATVNFTAVHQDTTQERMCSSVYNVGNGTYNCTIANTTHSSWKVQCDKPIL